MKRLWSPSLLRFLLVSFVVVALPLVGAIVTAILQLDQLARDSRHALVAVQQNTSNSRAIADRVTLMERNARQYQALMDESYKELYSTHRDELLQLFDQLTAASSDAGIQRHIVRAKSAEEVSHAVVGNVRNGATVAELGDVFASLRRNAAEIVDEYDSIAEAMAREMPERAANLQRLLMFQAALVIPFSIGLAGLFVTLILRPLRQLDRGIRSLGDGARDEPLQVSGTRDLQDLGERLDWLRLRLVELESLQASFLRNVSHELKTPLTNIREGAELLAADVPTEATQRRAVVSIVKENSIRLQRLIEELLGYNANTQIDRPVEKEPVSLDLILRRAIDEHASTLAARHVTVTGSIDPVTVSANPKQIRIVVDNLLSNAVKYAGSDGYIQVDLQRRADAVVLDIRDSGPGVRPQDRPRVFEWFFRGPRPENSLVPGTGMGLAIAREYARQHDGEIRLMESSVGAHFRFTMQDKRDDC